MLKKNDEKMRLVIKLETSKGSLERVIEGKPAIEYILEEAGIYDDELQSFIDSSSE